MDRSSKKEMLDGEDIPEKDLHASLDFMRAVNRFFGGTRAVAGYFSSRPLPAHFSVLDLGCGSGDIPYALSRWAASRGKKADITAIDLNPACVAYAESHFRSPGLNYRVASAFDLDFSRYDFVISSMFFHHLSDPEITSLLARMSRVKKGFLINDLYRSGPACAGAAMLSAFSFHKMVRNDAVLSVRRSFIEDDFRRYAAEAGLKDAQIERRPWFRITLGRHA